MSRHRNWLAFAIVAVLASAQSHEHVRPAVNEPVLAPRDPSLRPALLLLREGKTEAARKALTVLAVKSPRDAEIQYQIARSHLMDFYAQSGTKGRIALNLALEALNSALSRQPDHIPALSAKSVIHARAELLHYDPNLAFQLAARVAQLQPHANSYLVNLSEWLSGEVRFSHDSGHRVPHDPLLGLDRSTELLELVIDGALPNSNEESAAIFLLAKALSRRGDYESALPHFRRSLERAVTPEQKSELYREYGASLYRMARFDEAARNFYQAVQAGGSLVDRWLLHVALEGMGRDRPTLPANVLFPVNPSSGKPAAIEFEDMAPALGINRLNGNGTCSWGDVDQDGDQDLVLAGSGYFVAVYRNDGARFTEITKETGLSNVPSGYSLNLVDYDNDGRLDLFVSLNGWSGPMQDRLYRNTGGARFVDVTKETGVGDPGSGFISLWGDLDNDGRIDLVVANGVLKDGSTPQIYRNNGTGSFTNMTNWNEPAHYGAIGIALGDYDRDGDLDILINGLDTAPNRLYRNDGGWRFTEVAQKVGLNQPPHNGFVCFFTDYDNDGWPDVLTTSLAPWEAVVDGLRKGYAPPRREAIHPDAVRLFKNNRDGTFTDVTWESKLYTPMGVMGAGVADLDNNGFVDFYFGTGDPQLSRLEPNRLYLNNGDGSFSDVTSQSVFARPGNKGHGVSFIDFDNDGDLDLYAQLGGHYPGDHARNAFYRNKQGNKNNWMQFELEGVKSNRFAIGASVELKVGGMVLHREVKGSEGFGATNPYRLHFGLGQHTRIDSAEVIWPGGKRKKLAAVEVNRLHRVREE